MLYAAALIALLLTIESSLLSAFSNAGAWGVVGLVLFWYARQREKDIETSRTREETLKNEISQIQQKRVEDIGKYADALRELLSEQHDAIRDSALAMNGVKELLELLRAEGYILKRPSANPADARKGILQ
jgi:hypothetical protein